MAKYKKKTNKFNYKATPQVKAFEKKFKDLYGKQLKTAGAYAPELNEEIGLAIEDFIAKGKKTVVTQSTINLAKFIGINYLQSLKQDMSLITNNDINIMCNLQKLEIVSPEIKFEDLKQVLIEISNQASRLQLGNRKHCEKIYLKLDKLFKFEFQNEAACNTAVILIKNDLFTPVKQIYTKYITNISSNTKSDMFLAAYEVSVTKGNFEYLCNVIKFFALDIDCVHLVQNQENGKCHFTPLSFAIHVRSDLQDKYLELLCTQLGHHPDSDTQRKDFLDIHKGYSALSVACFNGKLQTVKLLLKYGADINLIDQTNDSTPFYEATFSKNLELIQFLMDQGADISLARNVFINLLKKQYDFSKLTNGSDPEIIMPIYLVPADLDSPEGLEFTATVCSMIKKHYLDKLLSSIESSELESKDEALDSNGSVVNPHKALDEYITFAEIEQEQSTKAPASCSKRDLESTCDLLLLKFCRSGSVEDLTSVQAYMEEHPELRFYPVTSALKLVEEIDFASQIFAMQPKLLHKFCTLKKGALTPSLDSELVVLPNGVHKVEAGLKNNVYIMVSPVVKNNEFFHIIEKKVLELLDSCSFVKANSKGISGIKTYGDFVKLKIADHDLSLVSYTKYIDNATGDVFFCFDKIQTHKENSRAKLFSSKDIMTIRVDGFKQLWQDINLLEHDSVLYPEEAPYIAGVPEAKGEEDLDLVEALGVNHETLDYC